MALMLSRLDDPLAPDRPLIVILGDDTDEEDHDLLFPTLRARGVSVIRVHPHDIVTRMGPDGVEFKAEVGAIGFGVAQIQGVWVPPHLRGQGRAIAGMAAVVNAIRAEIAPCAALYVNDFNTAAIAVYRRIGFRTVGEYATVLF